jgi:hypothetical protein
LARQKFLALLAGDQANSKSLLDASKWFIRHIEIKIGAFWSLIQPSLVGLDEVVSPIKPEDFAFVYPVLTDVLRKLSEIDDLALSTVVDDLVNDNFLRDDGDEREGVNQFAFTVIGWLSMPCHCCDNTGRVADGMQASFTTRNGVRNHVNSKYQGTISHHHWDLRPD